MCIEHLLFLQILLKQYWKIPQFPQKGFFLDFCEPTKCIVFLFFSKNRMER